MAGTFGEIIRRPKVLFFSCLVGVVLICGIFFVATFLPKNQSNTGIKTSNITNSTESSNSSAVALYSCLKKVSDSVEKIPGLYSKLAVSSEKSLDWGVMYTDNGVRKFSLASFKDYNITKDQENQIHFTQKRDDGAEYLTFQASLQICSESNMTVLSGYISNENVNDIVRGGSNTKSLSSVTDVGWIHAPETTGKYRVDAYIFYEGKWRLSDRMNIEFN